MGGGKSGESWRDPEAAPPAPRVLVFRCWRHDVVVTAARWPSRWFSGSEGLCLPGLSAPPPPPSPVNFLATAFAGWAASLGF